MSDASLMLGLDYFLASLAPASPYGQAQARTLRPPLSRAKKAPSEKSSLRLSTLCPYFQRTQTS
ncbi:MAG: hypothetical protein DDT37_00357 [Firmicutes bacterium]|nr:hypothetical protein [candidate division NPL-UPA2 bacterium]